MFNTQATIIENNLLGKSPEQCKHAVIYQRLIHTCIMLLSVYTTPPF